jgi:hypothetical protein
MNSAEPSPSGERAEGGSFAQLPSPRPRFPRTQDEDVECMCCGSRTRLVNYEACSPALVDEPKRQLRRVIPTVGWIAIGAPALRVCRRATIGVCPKAGRGELHVWP